MRRPKASTRDWESDAWSTGDLDILATTLIILNRYTIYSVRSSTDIIDGREAGGQQTHRSATTQKSAGTCCSDSTLVTSGKTATCWSEIEGNDMDVLLGLLPGSRRGDVAQSELLRLDRTAQRSSIPVTPKTMEAREMVLYLFWFVTLTAPLIALMLSAGCTPLPRVASETGFVATAHDATAATVAPEVAGEFWKRDHSREIKFGPAGIVSIIERAGPPDEELTMRPPRCDHRV